MTAFAFAALIVTAVIVIFWGTMALALRRPPQEQVATEETGPGSGLSIAEPRRRLIGRSRLFTCACGDRRHGVDRRRHPIGHPRDRGRGTMHRINETPSATRRVLPDAIRAPTVRLAQPYCSP
jgi:hypothetical protein